MACVTASICILDRNFVYKIVHIYKKTTCVYCAIHDCSNHSCLRHNQLCKCCLYTIGIFRHTYGIITLRMAIGVALWYHVYSKFCFWENVYSKLIEPDFNSFDVCLLLRFVNDTRHTFLLHACPATTTGATVGALTWLSELRWWSRLSHHHGWEGNNNVWQVYN